jgi:hypothetical protein
VESTDKKHLTKTSGEKQQKEIGVNSKILRQPKRYSGGYDELIVFEQELAPHLLLSTESEHTKIWFTHGLLDSEARIARTELLFSDNNSIEDKIKKYSEYWKILKP